MSRFYLGKNAAGKDLWGDGSHPYVDLRGRIPGDPQPNQGTVYKDSGVIWHHNGPKVVHKDLDQLAIDARYHMRLDAFGPGATPNGIQYEWAVGGDGTKYRLRNPGASLWHCGNALHNVRSFATTFLIGEGQRITAAAKESARELTDALLKIQGLDRTGCRGHRDVNPSTCPGTAYEDFVLPYRAGKLAAVPKPPAPPVQPSRPELLYLLASGALDVGIARAVVKALKSSGFPKAYEMITDHDILEGSRKALGSPVRPGMVIGGPVLPKLHSSARSAFEDGERDRLMDCVGKDYAESVEKTAWRLSAFAGRAGLDQLKVLTTYRAELPKSPKPTPEKPAPRPTLSKVDKAIAYELALIDPPTVYGFWDGAFPFTPGPAMWANVKAGAAPDPKTGVPNASCTGLINLGNAAAGIAYRSGTLGYAKDLMNKRPYKPGMVVKKGEVLLDRFMETSNEDEGHVVQAIETGTNPRVISSDHRFGGNKPGVNVHRLADSYKLFDYDFVGEVPGLGAG